MCILPSITHSFDVPLSRLTVGTVMVGACSPISLDSFGLQSVMDKRTSPDVCQIRNRHMCPQFRTLGQRFLEKSLFIRYTVPTQLEMVGPNKIRRRVLRMISQEAEDLVLLDGHSCASTWPTPLAESLLADPTPWWGSWPGDPADTPNRGPDFARLVNCVYGYARYARWHDLKLFYVGVSDAATHYETCPTQRILDALHFEFCRERFGYGHIRHQEPLLRQALQEVVSRVHSAHPPSFLAVTRLTYTLMHHETRLGVLTPTASRGGRLFCYFAADPAWASIQPLFEEAHRQMEQQRNRHEWNTSHQHIAVLGLTLFREDGQRMELNALHIHETEASFYLSKERLLWDQQAFRTGKERNK